MVLVAFCGIQGPGFILLSENLAIFENHTHTCTFIHFLSRKQKYEGLKTYCFKTRSKPMVTSLSKLLMFNALTFLSGREELSVRQETWKT